MRAKTFAEKLKELMQANGVNSSQLAKMTGISNASISGYLNGDHTPPKDKRQAIAEALEEDRDCFEGKVIVRRCEAKAQIPTLSITEAAGLMGVSTQTIREGLIQRIYPWGYAVKRPNGRWVYWINAIRFCETERVAYETGVKA